MYVSHVGVCISCRHVGDLGNVVENPVGSVIYDFTDHVATLIPGPYSILGRAIVVSAPFSEMSSYTCTRRCCRQSHMALCGAPYTVA